MTAPASLVVAAVIAALATALTWSGMRPVFARSVFERTNYRGVRLPTAVGLVLPVAMLFTTGLFTVAATVDLGVGPYALGVLTISLWTTLGFGLLGLLDDLAVDEGASGFKGHVRALVSGRLNAGSLKLVAGPALALVVVAPVSDGSLLMLVLDGALVAASANLANLLDRAPGRVLKCGLVTSALLVVVTGATAATLGVAVMAGAAAVLLVPDLRERFMLGDAGANPLGAVIGLGAVIACGTTTRYLLLVAVVLLNLASEAVSFSAVIERTPPLRALDRWGRRIEEQA